MRYLVASRYASGGGDRRLGPWPAGTEVDLSEVDADWINRDSPGTLRPVGLPEVVPAEAEPVSEVVEAEESTQDDPDSDGLERAATPARNRQHKPGQNRRT